MKRILLILLTALLLTGCGKKPEPTTPPDNTATQPAENKGQYIPGSSPEQQTGGAIRTYELGSDNYFDLKMIGNNLLVVGQKGLSVLTGEQGQQLARLDTEEIRENTVLDTAVTGIAYYLPTTRQVVVLNPQLQSVTKVELPKEIMGDPCISLLRNEVYYSTGSEIRALNMSTGISRLIRQQSAATQFLLNVCFDGTMLMCRLENADGGETTEMVSAETGQTVSQIQGLGRLETDGQQYVGYWQDGVALQTIFGTRGAPSQSFLPERLTKEQKGGRAFLPDKYAIVDHLLTDNGLQLSYYDLQTGKKTAQTVFNGVHTPTAFCSDGTYIWFLATDKEKTCHALYRWDISLSTVDEQGVCTGPLYTAQSPDEQGLIQCAALAKDYEKKYGVKLLFWQDAVKQSGGHTLTPVHQPAAILAAMEKLQPVLAQFPEKFLLKTVEAGWIRIALVQELAGETDWAQFWSEGDCWIVISVQGDVETAFLQGLAYGIDSHVLGNSRDFDTWSELNPKDFNYPYSENVNTESSYLLGKNRAFTDAKAMTYPHEDRCRIFYHAMRAENSAMFQSSVLQAKLQRLCMGIREAYDLEKSTETYPWEQYLKTSLAYIPK